MSSFLPSLLLSFPFLLSLLIMHAYLALLPYFSSLQSNFNFIIFDNLVLLLSIQTQSSNVDLNQTVLLVWWTESFCLLLENNIVSSHASLLSLSFSLSLSLSLPLSYPLPSFTPTLSKVMGKYPPVRIFTMYKFSSRVLMCRIHIKM